MEGKILNTVYVVGIGPGAYEKMTIEAAEVLRNSDVIIGYTVYVDLVEGSFSGEGISDDSDGKRKWTAAAWRLRKREKGKKVAMICSGDAGVYGMAGLMYEIGREFPSCEVQVIPGVTAATGGAAVLGAPLIHDFALISLSDLLTPWEKIEKRLRLAAEADFAICLYNPSSEKTGRLPEKSM